LRIKHGSDDKNGIRLVARDGFLLATLLAIPAFLLFWNMAPIFLVFGQPASVAILAKSYLHALAWGLPANFIMMACLEVIIGIGNARTILIFSVFETILNITFSYALIFGKFGLPALGIAGAGWGITISYWITVIAVITTIAFKNTYRQYFQTIFSFKKPSFLLELLQVGLPMGTMYCVEVGFFFALTLFMGSLFGGQIQAANQIALQFLGLLMSIMFAIAQSVTVRMGHLLGAKDVKAAEKVAYLGVGIVTIPTTIIALIYWFNPSILISLDFDINNPANFEIVRAIKSFFAVSAIFQILEAARIVLFGALRGLKDTRFTLLTSIISFWCIALPIGYLLATYFQFGSTGFWWGMVMSVGVSLVLLFWRFKVKIRHYYKIQ
jgi:MATE family multidrug resistance protein